MIKVFGKVVDNQTRCEHYASEKDIIAIKFYCCGKYYPCYKCHRETANHPAKRWPKEMFGEKAILCGICKTEHTIEAYMGSKACLECASPFNENCRFHYPIYFEV
ncbi:MAG TPA: CHY zinc finger protein [Pseudogracilibacillus sp.]|nr:CHY zinc finger protein [Pseudogracilibacillus sp.]